MEFFHELFDHFLISSIFLSHDVKSRCQTRSFLMTVRGNYQKSLGYFPQNIKNSSLVLWWNGFMNYFLHDYNKAITYWEKCYSEIDAEGDVTSFLYQHRIAYCYFKLNKKDKAELFLKKQYENLEKLSLTDKNMGYENRHYYDYAVAYAVKSDKFRTQEIKNRETREIERFNNLIKHSNDWSQAKLQREFINEVES